MPKQSREKELERALRNLVNALWAMSPPQPVPKRLNKAYIAAQSLLAKKIDAA